jgi:hypothetical protein
MSTAEIIGLIAIALLTVLIFSLVAVNSVRQGRRKTASAVGGAEGAYAAGSGDGAHCSPGDAGGSCDGGGGGS